jgi:hypothetical protein
MRRRLDAYLPPLALGLALCGLLWLLLGLTVYPGTDSYAYDYRAYLEAAVRLGETGSLYGPETLAGPYRPGPFGLYMYAPPLGLAVTPLTALTLDEGTVTWYMLHVVALGLACAVLPVRTIVKLAAFGTAAFALGVSRDLALGNVSALLLLPLALAWRWLDQPLGSIAQAVAISVRPTLGVLIVWQLLRRQWSAVAWTLGAGLVLVALTLPFVGPEGYADYLTVLRNMTGVTGVGLDAASTALALGADEELARLVLLATYAIGIGAVVASLRRDREVGYIVAVGASLLLSPLLWDHYLALLVLPGAFLAERGRPWGLALPLLSWLPQELLALVAMSAVVLPFLAREAQAPGHVTPEPGRSMSPADAPG